MTVNKQGKVELNAEKREILGSGLNRLRREGFIPAVLYGRDQESIPLRVGAKDFMKVLKSAGESTLVYLNVDGKIYPTIIHDVSRHPLKDTVLHADFFKVRLDEKIKAMVPVVFVGESPAVRDLGGIFIRNVNEIEVEALPQDLPHEISIDISALNNFDDQILVKNINLGPKVKVLASNDEIIGAVQEPISEEQLKKELEQPAAGVEEVKVIEKEKKPEEAEVEEVAKAEVEAPKKEGTPEKKEEKKE